MKLKSRSLFLTTMVAVSVGWLVPASVHSADAQKNPAPTTDTCSAMLVPEGVTCIFSPKTGQSIAVAEICQFMAAAISYPGDDMNPLKTGLGVVGSNITCKIDPQTGLVIGVPPSVRIKALPPIKSRQEKARSILAAATAAKGQDACTGMTVPDGMICLVRPSTGRPKAYWNDCANWIVPAGVACVIDPETGTAMTVARPD